MRMAKKPLNLLVDEDLVKKARDHGLVISRFLENKLQEYFSFIEAVSYHKNKVENKERPSRDLNPSPELDRLG